MNLNWNFKLKKWKYLIFPENAKQNIYYKVKEMNV